MSKTDAVFIGIGVGIGVALGHVLVSVGTSLIGRVRVTSPQAS